MNDSKKTILFIEIPKEKEPMLENFEACVKDGYNLSNEDRTRLKQKIPYLDIFIYDNDKIKFWRFVENPSIKLGNIILFYYNNILYIFETSDIIEDKYNFEQRNYEILKCPKPGPGHLPYAVLLRTMNVIYDRVRIGKIVSKIKNSGERISEYMYKYEGNIPEILNLSDFMSSKGYKFPDHLIAQFYTALKTKGFVILSGLSGTGKTKIALNFTKLLEKKSLKGKEIERLEEFMTSSGRNFKAEEEIKALKETKDNNGFAVKYFDYKGELAKSEPPIVLWIYGKTKTHKKVVMGLLITDIKEYSYNELPKDWKNGLQWIQEVYGTDLERELEDRKLCVKIKDIWKVNVEISEFKDAKDGKNLSPREDASRMGKGFIRVKSPEGLIPIERNYIFLPVKPDWRDSKPLLGYYNPLDKKYYKTPLLDLILRAERDYRENKDKALPYFIVLDEMNLARVEYYFSDFLSVLESGRDDDGFTRESIKLHNVDEVKKEQGIPKEIRLPPNLYIIGTVNIDETTYMFSPKVLDRAFVIEFHDVGMDDYPSSNEGKYIDYSGLRNLILEDLRNKGKFLVYSDKEDINKAIKELKAKDYWQILQKLNRALEPFDLHFGYRVIDEIALFFKSAKESMDRGIIQFKDDDEIFDSALLMKILPKFHGNKRKLEKPLKDVLKICLNENSNMNIDELKYDDIIEILQNWEIKCHKFRFKHTAKKVLKMLRQLYDVGFASFS